MGEQRCGRWRGLPNDEMPTKFRPDSPVPLFQRSDLGEVCERSRPRRGTKRERKKKSHQAGLEGGERIPSSEVTDM